MSPSLGGQIYDPDDPMGKSFFNILATFAEYARHGGRFVGHLVDVDAGA